MVDSLRVTRSVTALVKQSLVGGLGRPWAGRRRTSRVVVLCYHSIHPTKSFASATPDAFRRHLDWLIENCEVVPLHRVAESAPHGEGTRPMVAITFDDGYADNFEIAFPLLHERHLPATFFVTVGLLEQDPTVVARIRELRRSDYEAVRPMEWAHVRTLRAAGMEIGAHTYSHPNLARVSTATSDAELRRSKQILEDRLGEPIRSMAFPFGKLGRHVRPETVALAEAAGYEYACAVLFRAVRPSDSRFAIPRFFVAQDDVGRLRDKVLGAWDLVGAWQERSPVWLARWVSPEDFPE